MKKEVFFAIFLGFVLGLIITFGIWTANKSLKQANIAVVNPQPSLSAATSAPAVSPTLPPAAITLSLSSPADESLLAKASTEVTGKTAPNATVVLYYDLGDQIITAGSTGNFTATVPLESGFNLITVTAYDDKGNTTTQDLTVTYTTQKI